MKTFRKTVRNILIIIKSKFMLKKYLTTSHLIMVGIIVGLVVLLSQVDSCRGRDFMSQQAKIDSLTLANQQMVQVKNSLDQIVTKQAVIITQDQESLKDLTDSIFALNKKDQKRIKQIDALIQINSQTHVSTVNVPYVDTIARKKFSDSVEKACADVIAYYRNSTVELTDTSNGELSKHVVIDSNQNKHFQFDGSVLKDKFRINSVNFPDKQSISIVETKGGLLKRGIDGKVKLFRKKTMEIQVLHTNPYIKVTGVSSIVYKPPVKGRWVERAILFGAGIAFKVFILK